VRSQDGYTLVEVVVALVILSVGLLGLEALGIGASRMVNRAQRQSEYTEAAANLIENAMATIRNNQTPADATTTHQGATLALTTVRTGQTFRVSVKITPPTTTKLFSASDTTRITSYVFRP
jgi:type IV pilus modification protein PilV